MMNEIQLKPNITVFFPVYNDERTVRRVTEKAIQVCEETAGQYEIIIVNDCSPDNSGKIADELAIEHKFVRVVHHITTKCIAGFDRNWLAVIWYLWIERFMF